MAASVVKSIRVTPTLDSRIKAVLLDSRQDQTSHRRPMKEAEAMGIALDVGIQELERRTIGWKWECGGTNCRQLIESVRDGLLEWVEVDEPQPIVGGKLVGAKANRDLRLVHSGASPNFPLQRCVFDQRAERAKDGGVVASHSLAEMVGADGFLLLSELAKKTWVDTTLVERMWKRLFVPGYEQVHRGTYVRDAIKAGVIKQRSMSWPSLLHVSDIEAVARWMATANNEETHIDGIAALRILGKSPDAAADGDDE